MQAFINKHSQITGRVKQQQTDMARARHKSNPRASMGLDRRTISNRARQRDNPGTRAVVQERCKQSLNGKAKGKSRNTARIKH